jgi:hypothetical protein
MKINIFHILTLVAVALLTLLLWPRDDTAIAPEIRVATARELTAINHMGPGYWYTRYPDGRLYVDRRDGQGKRRLRY